MDITNDTLVIIRGGGRGTRPFPFPATRSKLAAPNGATYPLMRKAACLIAQHDAEHIPILTGGHHYRMAFGEVLETCIVRSGWISTRTVCRRRNDRRTASGVTWCWTGDCRTRTRGSATAPG